MKPLYLRQDEPRPAATQDNRGDDQVQPIQVPRMKEMRHRDAAALYEQPSHPALGQSKEKFRQIETAVPTSDAENRRLADNATVVMILVAYQHGFDGTVGEQRITWVQAPIRIDHQA